MEEEALVCSLFTSLSSVFRRAGSPVDVAYVLQMIRSAIVNRGLTKNTCVRLVDAIQVLSKFGAGFLTIEELENGLRVGAHDAAMQPVVSTIPDVLQLAASLSNLSWKNRKQASPIPVTSSIPLSSLHLSDSHSTMESILPERCTTPSCEEEPVTSSSLGSTDEGPTTPPLSPSSTTTNSFSDCSPLSRESFSSGFGSPSKGSNQEASIQTLEIDVPPHKVAKLSRSNMRRIEAISGAKLVLYQEIGEKVLMITGNQRQCAEARMMVLGKVNEPDLQTGALYRVPYGFFNQPKLYMEEMFKEIGGVSDCELRALRDVNTGLGFIFIRGSLSSDVECCTKSLQKWEKSFLQQRSSHGKELGVRVIDANTPSPSNTASGIIRVKYSREELVSLCSFTTPTPKFQPFAEALGIVIEQPQSPITPTTPIGFFQSPAKTAFGNEADGRWEHDLFDPAF